MAEFIDDEARLREAASILCDEAEWLDPNDPDQYHERQLRERYAALLLAVADYHDPYSWPCMWMTPPFTCPHCAAVAVANVILGD